MSRIVLAMSGGVDSSVAAHLLCEQGHDVIGVFMRHGHNSPVACDATSSDMAAKDPVRQGIQLPVVSRLDHKQGCCTAADAADARRVADKLGIPFYALDLEEEFARIIDYFVAEYTIGRTPNPCVQCNNWIKFGKLFDYADSVGAEFVATGHYARIANEDGNRVELLRGRDETKDQSYVLFGIKPHYLHRMMLPVGGFEKTEIRRRATHLGLRVADKKDSQEICFVTQGRYDELVRGRRGDRDTSGEIVTTDGQVVGMHQGIESFTVGQRKGLGVALGEPYFVVKIDADARQVVLGNREELARQELTASQANWLDQSRTYHAGDQYRCYAQFRYNAQAAPAQLLIDSDQTFRIRFDQPQHAIAPGQAVVCFDADHNQRVLGGGWIGSAQ